MKLTKSEYSYFYQIASKENHRLLTEFTKETERIGFSADKNLIPHIYRKRLIEYAVSVIESRVQAYIDTFDEFEKYPDKEDLDNFIEEVRPYVLNKRKFYIDFLENPFRENLPESIVQASIETFDFELQGIFREGLRPLEIYYAKGIAIEEKNAKALAELKKRQKQEAQKSSKNPWTRGDKIAVAGAIITILAIIASLTIPELRKWFGLPN